MPENVSLFIFILDKGPGYDIKLDPAVLPLLTSFGRLVAGRACAVLLPIIVQCVNIGGGGAVCVACGRLGMMGGGSVVGQTVQPVQAWKNGR